MTSAAKAAGEASSAEVPASGLGTEMATDEPLSSMFPLNSYVEMTCLGDDDGKHMTVRGTVYTTDEISQSVVLLSSLPHTTLSYDVRIIHSPSIVDFAILAADASAYSEEAGDANDNGHADAGGDASKTAIPSFPPSTPLTPVRTHDVAERERAALARVEEALLHVNDEASPHARAVFDRLLKACNVVRWVDGVSILVLNQIRVDPPYSRNNCTLDAHSASADNNSASSVDALERVKKIVEA